MELVRTIKKYSWWLFWLSFVISLVLLFMPGSEEPGIPYVDKVAHFLLFAWLFLIGGLYYKRHLILLAGLLVIYSLATEFIQDNFIPNRYLDWWDSGVAIIGIILVYIFFKKFTYTEKIK